MKNLRWLAVTIISTIIFLLIVVSVNFCIDTYGVRSNLFCLDKVQYNSTTTCSTEMNRRISNLEYILQNPFHFDSFIFGSSRMWVIDASKINSGRYYNMSYAGGLPVEHLAMVKALLKKGVRIKSVIIGLDEFSFNAPPEKDKKQLVYIMHPFITGKSLVYVFYQYYFRIPKLVEISKAIDRLSGRTRESKCVTDQNGFNIGWLDKEKTIIISGKSSFARQEVKYHSITYDSKELNVVLNEINELILLSRKNNFSLIFFINPIYSQYYTLDAAGLYTIKEKLAQITDYYDFSGLNSVTTNDLSFLDDIHYRYLVGDMIIKRIFGFGDINIPDDFGVLVTKNNVENHVNKQKLEMKKYMANKESMQ